jgi:photosystem II stability/assembly factor-like uncharacterized protein
MCFDPENPGLVVVGGTDYGGFSGQNPPRTSIWRSTNGGSSWEQTYTGSFGLIQDLAIAGSGASRSYLACLRDWNNTTQPRLIRSTDLGRTWNGVTPAGFPYFSPFSLGVSRQHPDRVYVSSYFGTEALMRSEDAGRTWTPTRTVKEIYDILVHPDDDQVLYGLGAAPKGPVIRSRDGGETFADFSDGLAGGYGQSLSLIEGECPLLLLGANTRRAR